MKIKEGINYNPEDPNYDLFRYSMKVSAKRLFPNYTFIDAPFNLQYYKEGHIETEVATMGCVEEHSRVHIRYKGIESYIEFKDLFEKIENTELILKERGRAEYFDTSTIALEVYDTYSKGFVKVLTLLRNKDVHGWAEITFSNGTTLVATLDHPLPIEGKGRTFVSDIAVGDKIREAKSDRVLEIVDIKDCGDRFDGHYSYDVETESDRFDVGFIQSHNCRTRVIGNVYDPDRQIVTGRGNLSFTSINLPRLAIESNNGVIGARNIDKFFELLNEKMELVHRQLYERYKVQCRKHPRNYPFLMGQGIWIDSDKLWIDDDISEVLRHGSLSVGFIGLAETLKMLIGKHHGESDEAQKLGLKIIGYMRELTDKWSAEEKMNYGVIGTPAEGLSGRFIKIDQKRYGKIPGVTDREYYTNSSHIPVYYPISAFEKIHLEAPYHELENAGHICYIELDGDPSKNIDAFEAVIRCMHDEGVGYGAINHPVDRDPACGYVGIIGDVCPRCGRRDGEPMTEEMWRKIKGLSAGDNADTVGYHGDLLEEADRMTNRLD